MLSSSSTILDWLHDYACIFLIFILIFVRGLLVSLIKNYFLSVFLFEISMLEVIWTILPAVILISLGVPSLIILYQREKNFIRNITVKVTGHQWFWRYDFRDFKNIEFDRYIKPFTDLKVGEFRLLETDNCLVFPIGSSCQFLINSSDVLHRWALPSLSIKADANPGRMNIIRTSFPICGLYYGQCSEICGANHSFIPICLEVTSFRLFKNWIKSF